MFHDNYITGNQVYCGMMEMIINKWILITVSDINGNSGDYCGSLESYLISKIKGIRGTSDSTENSNYVENYWKVLQTKESNLILLGSMEINWILWLLEINATNSIIGIY